MMSPADHLEPLALELRSLLPEVPADFIAQRRRLAGDPRARIGHKPWAQPAALSLAFAALLLLALGAWQLQRQQSTALGHTALISGDGHRHADGSFVSLAPGGLGRVLESSDQNLRYELVSGRANVSVLPQVGHHWTIAAGPYAVNVIGTAFHVDFTPPSTLVVAVEHGVVSVAGGLLGAPVRLEKGARLQVQHGGFTVEGGSEPGAEPPGDSQGPAATNADASQAPAAREALEKKPSEDWEAFYGQNDYRKAVAQAHAAGFEQLVGSLPEAKLSKLADAARLGGDENGARLALQAQQRRFPGSAGSVRAVFLLGTLEARSGGAAAAISSFQKYLSLAPNGAFASEAMGRLMQLYAQGGQGQEAASMATSYLKREPNGPYARLAQSLSKAP